MPKLLLPVKVLVARVGVYWIGIRLRDVSRIAGAVPLRRAGETDDDGLRRVGHLFLDEPNQPTTPVVDLRAQWLGAPIGARTGHVIVCRSALVGAAVPSHAGATPLAVEHLGLLVDEATDVVELNERTVVPMPKIVASHAGPVGLWEIAPFDRAAGGLLPILDPRKLLFADVPPSARNPVRS